MLRACSVSAKYFMYILWKHFMYILWRDLLLLFLLFKISNLLYFISQSIFVIFFSHQMNQEFTGVIEYLSLGINIFSDFQENKLLL